MKNVEITLNGKMENIEGFSKAEVIAFVKGRIRDTKYFIEDYFNGEVEDYSIKDVLINDSKDVIQLNYFINMGEYSSEMHTEDFDTNKECDDFISNHGVEELSREESRKYFFNVVFEIKIKCLLNNADKISNEYIHEKAQLIKKDLCLDVLDSSKNYQYKIS